MKNLDLSSRPLPKETDLSLSLVRTDEKRSALPAPPLNPSPAGKEQSIPLDPPPEKVSGGLLSFGEKISRLSRLSDWLLFLKNNTPKLLKSGEFVLFYESQQFGLRRAYIKDLRFYEETAQTPWLVPTAVSFNAPEGNLYLTREMGRVFSRVLIVPFSNKNNLFPKGGRPPVLFAELLRGRENKRKALDFFQEKKDIMDLVLKRILQNTHKSRASYLWNYIFESWGEALAIVRGGELIRANRYFNRLLSRQPNLPHLIKTKSFFQADGRSYQFHYRPILPPSAAAATERENPSPPFSEAESPSNSSDKQPPSSPAETEVVRSEIRRLNLSLPSPGASAPAEKKAPLRPEEKRRWTKQTNRLQKEGSPLRENPEQNIPQPEKTRPAPLYRSCVKFQSSHFPDSRGRGNDKMCRLKNQKPENSNQTGITTDLSEKGLIHCRDLTSYLQLKEDFLQSEKMTAIGRLGQNIAHELNNPLTGLRAMSQILIRDKSFEKFSEDFRAVESAAVRSQKIIESFLTFSRSKKTEKRACNVNTIVRETLPLLKTLSRRIEIRLSLKDTPPPIVYENPSLLQQMIFNLMTNACHAVRHLQGWQKPRIEVISAIRPPKTVSLEIKDNGCGISKDHGEKIFQPFWTTKNPGEGTGLGLGIVRRFVQNARGDIRVVSELNKGSCFTVFLPLYF